MDNTKINKSNVTSGTEVKQVNVVVKKGEYQSARSIQINKDFLTKVKIDSEHTIYKVICRDCVSYMLPASSGGIVTSAIIQGRMDGKEQEFKTKELAQLAID